MHPPHPNWWPSLSPPSVHRCPCALQAKERYAQLADMLNLGGSTPEEKVIKLIEAVEDLKAKCGVAVSRGAGGVGVRDQEGGSSPVPVGCAVMRCWGTDNSLTPPPVPLPLPAHHPRDCGC